MTHDEVAELLGAYALHALDADERALVDDHLATCPHCRSEARDHEQTAALLGNSGGAAPEGLWDRIATSLDEAPPPLRLAVGRRRPRRLVTVAAGLAAAAVIAVLGGLIVHQDHRIDHLQSALGSAGPSRDLELALVAPGAHRASLTSDDGRVVVPAVVLPDGSGYLLAEDMPSLPAGQTYQLWGQTDAGLLSLGVLGSHPGRVVAFHASGVGALAITAEQAPGVTRSAHSPVVAGRLD